MKELGKQAVDPMRQAEIVLEACFGVEDIMLDRLRAEAEAAAAYAVRLATKKIRGIRDSDILRAQSVAAFKLAAYETELLRLYGEGQFSEEEEALARLDGLRGDLVSPEDAEEDQARYGDINDPEDVHNPYPVDPWTGETQKPGEDDEDGLEPA